MKAKTKLRIKSLVLGVALGSLCITPVHAGLQDALDGMLMSNITDPSAYKSQTRGGFVMGSVVARSPIRSINIIAFDPPRLNAGCGGIDLFGGSFSFINADQLVALFRTIATNAVGALFYLAIQKIQPDLANLMSKFQSMMHALNLGNKNTCAIANQLVTMAFDPKKTNTDAQNEKGVLESITSTASDLFDSIAKMFSDGGSVESHAMSGGVPVESSSTGNLTWKALVRSSNSATYGEMFGSTVSDQQRTMEIIQSILGTQIVIDEGTDKTDKGRSLDYAPTIINLRSFVEGIKPDQKVEILGCPDNAKANEAGCNKISTKTLTSADWSGVRGMVNKNLFGTADGLSVTSDGLVHKIIYCGSESVGDAACDLTLAQKSFVDQVKTPIIYYLRRSQGNPSMALAIAQRLAPLVVEELAINYFSDMLDVVNKTWNHSGGEVARPESVDRVMLSLRDEMNFALATQGELLDRLKKADDIIALMVKNNPNIIPGGG